MAYPVTLNGRTYTLADFEGTNYVNGFPDALEDFVTQAGNIYTTTSTSSVAIGTGSKTFTVADSGKPYIVGTPLRIADSAAPSTNWIDGIVTSYSGTTLVVNAVAYAGSGTIASWNINLGGGPIAYTGTLPIAQGGTGATTAAAAATNLGLGTGDSPTFAGVTIAGDLTVDTNTLHVDSTNNRVGIGTASPSAPLDVVGSPGTLAEFRDGVAANFIVETSGAVTTIGNQAGSSQLAFKTSNSEAMRIDASGRVGIGTSSPSNALHLANTSGPYVVFQDNDAGSNQPSIGTEGTAGSLIYNSGGTSASHIFKLNRGASEAARINASGDLLVATTDPIAYSTSTTSGAGLKSTGVVFGSASGVSGIFNRRASDGDIVTFRKDGTTVGSIGTVAGDPYLRSQSDQLSFYVNGETNALFYVYSSTKAFTVGLADDNTADLGRSTARWDDVYATNGTIQTSDANEKQDVEELNEAERRVAVAAKGLIRKYRWIDAVQEKGDDARIHVGIIAQDLKAAFEAEGLDPGRYAMFISSTWWEKERVIPAVEAQDAVYEDFVIPAVLDDEGNEIEPETTETRLISEAVEGRAEQTVIDMFETAEEAPEGATERTRLGVRYPELLAFIISAL